jgi:hypothetical protein
MIMTDSRLHRFLDRVQDARILVALWVTDRLFGPEPVTLADRIREARHERLRRLLPGVDVDGTGAKRPRKQ